MVRYTGPLVYCRARCYPYDGGYNVELVPATLEDVRRLPGPEWFPSLGDAMAWAYCTGNRPGYYLDGLTLSATRAQTA